LRHSIVLTAICDSRGRRRAVFASVYAPVFPTNLYRAEECIFRRMRFVQSRPRQYRSARAIAPILTLAVRDAKPAMWQGLNFFVDSAGLALGQSGFDPARDRGEDFRGAFVLESAHSSNI